MAPKKKGNKKADDDWEAEALGESIDPTATGTQEANAADVAKEKEDGSLGGGGLLAALKKNKQNKKRKGKVVEEDLQYGEDRLPTENAEGLAEQDRLDTHINTPTEATADKLFDSPAAEAKAAKARPGKKSAAASANDDDSELEFGGLKSKKEKEKERKEREKQRKKDQVSTKATHLVQRHHNRILLIVPFFQATKRKTTPAPVPAPKFEPENAQPESQTSIASVGDTSKGGKKKVPAALAALQRQQERLRKQQEEKEKADAEAKARIEEEERLAAEEERKKEEARQRRKDKEKEKKEQLKKEGKLLTPAQKEQQRRNDIKRQQMIAAGMKVTGMDEDLVEKKKPVYDSKKKKGNKKLGDDTKAEEERAAVEAAEAEAKRQAEELELQQKFREETEKAQAEAEATTQESEIDELDDWEKVADAKETYIKESWEDSEDESTAFSAKSADKAVESTEKHPIEAGPKTYGVDGSHSRSKAQIKSASGSESEDSEDEAGTATQRAAAQKKAEVAARRKQEHEQALAARSKDNLRSPICCILGHVDTGKTKLLDKVRQTNVQEGEAGGITQQIGATYFPVDALKTKTEVVNQDGKFEFKVPGLLVIDTPGHESFTNLRSRGSSLCNIAILVVDIMHGLEPQTLESMRLLRERKTPFIVALNKIDRLYNWKKIDNNGFLDSFTQQSKGVQNEFRDRLERAKLAFSEQGFNAELFSENKSMARNVSLVPTSAHTGEGIPDMLKLLVTLTQERMTNQLMYLSEVECTVLEVKVIEGLGTTIDVVLSNGVLREGDRIVLCGLNGAISTSIRALLTPAPLKELRLKSQYVHNHECKASLGVKIAANDLENAIAGSRLLVAKSSEEEEDLEEEVMSDIENLLSRVSRTGRGVSVQASTLGSLEALLEFLKVSKIPVANISIGPVYKRDVMSAGIMLEKAREYAVMLCFDVKVDKEAQAYADEQGIKIFTADIIYHLFDDFTKHMAQLTEQKKEESKFLAVFPCVLQPIAVFMKKDPILVGTDVTDGTLKLHTPIAAVKINNITGVKEIVSLGRV